MEIPLYPSFKEFESNYIIDFAEVKPKISFLKYLDNCKNLYTVEEIRLNDEWRSAPPHFIEVRNKIEMSLSFAQLEYLEHRLEDGTVYHSEDGDDLFNYYWDLIHEFDSIKAEPSEVVEYAKLIKQQIEIEKGIRRKTRVIIEILDFINLKTEIEKSNVLAHKPTPPEPHIPEPEPYREKERGVNVPFKIALLDEMGVIEKLNQQFPNKSDIHRMLQFLTGGNIDNVKDYYNSIYGNYFGSNQITERHREKAKQIYYK